MKKLSLIISLGMVALLISSFAIAQNTTGTNWEISTSYSLSSTGGNVNAMPLLDVSGDARGIAVNTTTGNVYYTQYLNAPGKVYVLNVVDGTTTGMGYNGQGCLDTTIFVPAPTQQLILDKIKVADDGVIYACNLVINTTTQTFRIYRWQNETSPGIISYSSIIPFNGSTVGIRFGDAMGIIGSGVNTQIYMGGSGDNGVLEFTTLDGTTFNIANQGIGLQEEATGCSDISPVAVNGNFWVIGSGIHARLYNQSGLAIDSISGGVVASGGKGCAVGSAGNGETYMVVAQSASAPFTGTAANLVDITSGGTTAFVPWTSPASGTAFSNGNATGGTAIDVIRNNFYQLYSNNILGSYNGNPPMPVELSNFEIKDN